MILTPEQAAERLQVSPDLVRRLCASGEIRATKVGKTLWRIEESAIDELFGASHAELQREKKGNSKDRCVEGGEAARENDRGNEGGGGQVRGDLATGARTESGPSNVAHINFRPSKRAEILGAIKGVRRGGSPGAEG